MIIVPPNPDAIDTAIYVPDKRIRKLRPGRKPVGSVEINRNHWAGSRVEFYSLFQTGMQQPIAGSKVTHDRVFPTAVDGGNAVLERRATQNPVGVPDPQHPLAVCERQNQGLQCVPRRLVESLDILDRISHGSRSPRWLRTDRRRLLP